MPPLAQDPGLESTQNQIAPPPALGEGVEIGDLEPVAQLVDSTPSRKAYGQFKLGQVTVITDSLFPADSIVKTRARFWVHIFGMVSEGEGLVHDAERLEIVYGKVKAPGAYTRAGRKWVAAHLQETQADLRALAAWRAMRPAAAAAAAGGAASGAEPTDPVLRSLSKVVPADWDSAALAAAADRLRFQRGLKERFLGGLTRSYRWLPEIESTMVSQGLPKRLKYLPHVESSFMPSAYSKVGAAGMWQFMKATGRRYGLRADYLVDERRDPNKSTRAAARLLADSHRLLGSWPLALTGYNHGPAGVRRAVNAVGSSDLDFIIRNYDGKRFGFASGNFFAEFLAASSIAMLADSLFPGHARHAPLATVAVVLPKAVSVPVLLKQSGLSPAEFETYNLSLRPTVFRSKASLPKGMVLHFPADTDSAKLVALRQGLPVPQTQTQTALAAAAGTQAQAPLADKAASQLAQAALNPAPGSKPKVLAAAALPEQVESPARIAEKKIKPREAASPPAEPVLRAAVEPVSAALPKPTDAAARALASARVESEVEIATVATAAAVVENARPLWLAAMQAGDRQHPWDRFNPAVYGLAYTRVPGKLTFASGPQETLSHYAEWSGLGMAKIRTANRLRRRGLNLGYGVQLPLDSAQADAFIKNREEHYRATEEDFYGSYHVASLEPIVVKRGFSVWDLAMKKEIPFWLLQKHNAGRDLAALHPGDTVYAPVVEPGIRRWGFTRYADAQEALRDMANRLSQVP